MLLVAAALAGLFGFVCWKDAAASCAAGCGQSSGGAGRGVLLLAQAPGIDADTLQKYGAALGLGTRATQFPKEIAAIRDAVNRGDKSATVAAIQALYVKAGFLTPVGPAMDKLVGALPKPDLPTPTAGAAQPQGGTPLKPVDPYAGSMGGGPTMPLGQGAPTASGSGTTLKPVDPYAGSMGGGPTMPLGQGAPTASGSTAPPKPPVDPYAGSVGGGPTLPLGQGSPTTSSSAGGAEPAKQPSAGSAASSGSDDSILGPPPTPTVKLDPCGLTPASSGNGPITVGELVGIWTDSSTGEQLEIEPDTITGRSGGIVLRGRHNWWNVSLQGQTLKACRMPQVEEMGDAPDWARQQAYGKIKWELELDATADRGQLTLEGKWYPGSYHWTEAPGADASALPQRTVSDFGRGTPIAKKFIKPPPAISDVVVLTDQTAFVTRDLPKWPYSSAAGDQRVLFIYGRGLPRRWSDAMEFKSEDPNVSYMLIAMSADKSTHPARKEILEAGWREARKNLDADTIRLTQGLDALLVYARTTSRVLPGTKRFTLNGADGSWRLRFGDDRASISFMRAITEDVADPTNNLVLPERVFLEVRTGTAFPIDSIPLMVQLNASPVTWGGAKTIEARRVEPMVYRTNTIEFVESGRPMPAAEQGVYFLPARVKDVLDVRLEDPFLLGVTPASTVARVIRTPAELGETWKEALLRAAKADGIDVSDWSSLPGTKATEFANYEVTPIILKALEFATPLKFLRYVPSVYRYVEEVERGKLREKTPVRVGEHAALLMFRDQFVKSMTAAADNLDQIKGEVALRGFREAIKLSAWDDDSPWRYLRVSCADGSSDCSFPMVVSDNYLERTFGINRKSADEWVRKAIDEAIQKYRQATRDAITKAKDIKDNDVRELMKLIGLSYLPLLPPVQARMMRLDAIGDPNRQLWVPDLNGRYELRNLHTVVDALQAQEDYSKLDTQMGMLLAAAVTAPFILEESAIAAAIAWGTDTVFLGVQLATDVPDFIEQRQEIHFALGASIILGTQRLQEAEFKKTEWFQLVAQLGPAVLGPIASTARMVGVVRTSLVLSQVERGGIAAFRELSEADKAAFWRYATESKLLEEIGEAKAMSQTHRRMSAVVDRLFEEMGLQKPSFTDLKLNRGRPIAAVGEPAPLAKTKTLRDPMPVAEETTLRDTQGEAGGAKPTEETLTLTEKSGASAAGEGTTTYGSAEPVVRDAPKAGQKYRTYYNGKIREFQLGNELGTGKAKGSYAQTFELVDPQIPGCEKGCVIKVLSPQYPKNFLFMRTGEGVVRNIERGALLVGDDVLQAKGLHYAPDAPRPYYIQERLQSGDKVFEVGAVGTYREFNSDAGLRKAVLDLFRKLRDKGLIWEDCHVGNIFFRKVNGEWAAGIFDLDRIIPFNVRDGDLGAYIGWVESEYMGGKGSLSWSPPNQIKGGQGAMEAFFHQKPGPYFPDIDFFWEKIMEAKGWVGYDPRIGPIGEYQQRYLFPSEVEQVFPRLKDPERLKTMDLTKQHWERQVLWLRPLELPAHGVELAKRRAANDELRRAA